MLYSRTGAMWRLFVHRVVRVRRKKEGQDDGERICWFDITDHVDDPERLTDDDLVGLARHLATESEEVRRNRIVPPPTAAAGASVVTVDPSDRSTAMDDRDLALFRADAACTPGAGMPKR